MVADVAARGVAEDQLRDRLAARAGAAGVGSSDVSAQISSFPFLGRLLVSGTISEVDVSLLDVTVRGVTFASVGVELRAVRIDRYSLVQDRRLALESIGRGTAVAEISGDEVSRLLGVTILFEDGQAQVRVGGELVTVAARLEGPSLVVEAGGITLPPIEIPPLPLVSDCLSRTEIVAGRLRLTCVLDEVPVELAGRSVNIPL